jgi:tRNA G46 methylase TrmB
MRRGAALILKTDHPDYFASSVTTTASVASRFGVTASSSDFWHDDAARSQASEKHFAGESSFFETRYLKKRRPIHYLEITKR